MTLKNKNKHKSIPFWEKIAFRLWLNMILLVLFSILFMWLVQIQLFERNYIDAAVAEINAELESVVQEVETKDLYENTGLLLTLSKAADGKVLLIDGDDKLIKMYSSGHPLLDASSLEAGQMLISFTKSSDTYERLKSDIPYSRVVRYNSEPIGLEIGIPAIYKNGRVQVVIYHKLDQLHTVLQINRMQLVRLSIILTLMASVIAALLSQHFLKPIRRIKIAVDKLAQGDFTATPGLKRRDELGALSDSVEVLSQELTQVDTLRKEVISNVSHELRAPLALIRGYAEMVRDISWKHSDNRNSDLNLIISESSRMSEMVSDIMDYSQVQAGYLQLKKGAHNLVEIIKSEVDFCQKDAARFGISIELAQTGEDFTANVDALKMCQVMRNLLNNAVNHTEDGGHISVLAESQTGAIKVSVMNPGDPIPQDSIKHIWERYQRAQHHGGRNRGTGIGLSIVRSYLEAHGISYGVYCENGLTTFWFKYLE